MTTTIEDDLKQLATLAYHRLEALTHDLCRYHALLRKNETEAVALLEKLHQWMLVPITLWPLNLQAIFCACLTTLEAGEELDEEMLFLLKTLPPLPAPEVCKVVIAHEHLVQKGHYEDLVKATAKFDSLEKEACHDPELRQDWNAIKERWDVASFATEKGVIRRSLSSERNFRPSFKVDWQKPEDRFQVVFDAFCIRWNLYGMLHDTPLTMKLSVNLTPHGTMIFIPSYWSFDAKRDVDWTAVMKLHRARVAKKQGAGLLEGTEQRRSTAKKLHKLDAEAAKLNLKGEELHLFLCKGLGLQDITDAKKFARLRQEFPKTVKKSPSFETSPSEQKN